MEVLNLFIKLAGGCVAVIAMLAVLIGIGAIFFESKDFDYED